MKILAIESSCDETGASVVEKVSDFSVRVLSNSLASSADLHAKTGGIIPENAARFQVEAILPVISEALIKSQGKEFKSFDEKTLKDASSILKDDIDAIAVTHGPGLIGSLLVGVETAKTLSFAHNKPIIPVNHLLAHIFANFITSKDQRPTTNDFPFLSLIVSGGHTDLLLFKTFTDYAWLGGTRDDAAGEALDKVGRLLDLSYPAGPEIEKRANKIMKSSVKFQSPLLHSDDFDFSFSGLKTEVLRFVQKNPEMSEKLKNEICYAVQKAVIDVLVKKTLTAAEKYNVKSILLGGGVSANQTLRRAFEQKTKDQRRATNIFAPKKKYSTDNAAMIGAYAALAGSNLNWKEISALPELYFA